MEGLFVYGYVVYLVDDGMDVGVGAGLDDGLDGRSCFSCG